MKWLNAFEYHRDEDKRNEVEALHWPWPTEGSRALFLALMLDKAAAVSYVHWIIGTLHQGLACDEPTCPSSTSVLVQKLVAAVNYWPVDSRTSSGMG
jgi:hypothetical protein